MIGDTGAYAGVGGGWRRPERSLRWFGVHIEHPKAALLDLDYWRHRCAYRLHR